MNSTTCPIERAFLNNTVVPVEMRIKNNLSHAFTPTLKVNLRGGIDCSYDDDCCLLIFKIAWNPAIISARFTAGDPNSPDDEGTPDMDRPAFVGGNLGTTHGCPSGHNWSIFPAVSVSTNGQTISVLNANPVGSPLLAYKINIVVRKTGSSSWRLLPIDPRIINR